MCEKSVLNMTIRNWVTSCGRLEGRNGLIFIRRNVRTLRYEITRFSRKIRNRLSSDTTFCAGRMKSATFSSPFMLLWLFICYSRLLNGYCCVINIMTSACIMILHSYTSVLSANFSELPIAVVFYVMQSAQPRVSALHDQCYQGSLRFSV
jgi:ABC-type protease/lipase transport system fused ATPase/permease subunit